MTRDSKVTYPRVEPCEMVSPRDHGGKWAIRTLHKSGILWACSASAHFATKREALEYVKAWEGIES